jgi:hypothetical protein
MRVYKASGTWTRAALVLITLISVPVCLGLSIGNSGARASESAVSKKMVRHFVAFKFKKTAKPEEIRSVVERFKQLQAKIPFVVSIEYGLNTSPEHLNKGLTHAFLVTFKNAGDRDRYLTHPEHLKFVASLREPLADSFVIDFTPSGVDSI